MKFNNLTRAVSVLSMVAVLSCACRGTGSKPSSVAAGGTSVEAQQQKNKGMVQYTYTVKNVFPHDVGSYTQGLYWHDGYLWEGTGQYGESALRKVDLSTGKTLKEVTLSDKYFGEGIALLDGKIYQLTWLESTCFVYDAETFEEIEEFSYSGEGWGITTDGVKLYMSNGSNEIKVVNPDGFKQESVIRVTMNKRRIQQLNELEWIDGRIWANIYGSESVVIIDPATGEVEGVVDFTGILPDADRTIRTDVFNGIAYDTQTKRIFVTGKYWNKLFEIKLKEK